MIKLDLVFVYIPVKFSLFLVFFFEPVQDTEVCRVHRSDVVLHRNLKVSGVGSRIPKLTETGYGFPRTHIKV